MKIFTKLLATGLFVIALVVGIGQLLAVNAVTAETEYSYNFTQVPGSMVANQATKNAAVSLNLYGNWTQETNGVRFVGDKVSKQSVAYGKPTSGPTLTAAGALGGAVEFTYDASVGICTKDSRNVTQVGRFGTGLSQLKIQLSNCAASKTATYAECRVVGAGAQSTDKPIRSTLPLVHGESYVVSCARDVPTGSTRPITLTVTRQAMTPHVNTFAYRDTGTFNATGYVSVANKYPLPAITSNSDQLNGVVSRVVYCGAGTLAAVDTCLASW